MLPEPALALPESSLLVGCWLSRASGNTPGLQPKCLLPLLGAAPRVMEGSPGHSHFLQPAEKQAPRSRMYGEFALKWKRFGPPCAGGSLISLESISGPPGPRHFFEES